MADNPLPTDVEPVGAPVAPTTASSAPNHSAEEAAAHDEIMRQIFGEVGELQNDFSCAVESTVLLHGMLLYYLLRSSLIFIYCLIMMFWMNSSCLSCRTNVHY